MQYKIYETERLLLKPLELTDASFMLKLLNTPGWLEFIGDKNASTIEGAEKYMAQFLNSSDTMAWVVTTKENQSSIGIISLIQRSYLPSQDIGFAFLPEFSKKGFAFEAAEKIVITFKEENKIQSLLATTLENNIKSQNLLKRLGLSYVKNMFSDTNEELMLFSSKIDN